MGSTKSKRNETKRKSQDSILDDIPFALPALTRANKLQKRCAKVGFDWQNPDHVYLKVEEELQEVHEEIKRTPHQPEKLAEELGDLLFATVNLCRHHHVDAETALRNANVKFENRFKGIEKLLKAQGKSLSDCSLGELDFLWNEIKTME